MKRFRVLSILLAMIMCFTILASCASGDSDETIKVGVLGPQTGDVAQYGIAVMNGAKLYIDEINAAGGVNGKTIELIDYDEEGDPTKAVTGYSSLLDQGVTAIIGSVTSGPTMAVVPEAFADNMPMITASGTAEGVTYDADSDTVYTNMFRSCFIDAFQGGKMATFAAEELGATTAAILYDTGDTYSTGLKEAFEATCEEVGIEILAVEGYASGSVDFQSQLTNIAATGADVLFLPVYYEDVSLIAGQADSAGVTATMLGADGWDTVLEVISDAGLLEGSYYCSGFSAEDESALVQDFLAAYKDTYSEIPNMFAAQGYDAAAILVAALEKAEAEKLEVGSDEYKQAIIDGMAGTDAEFVTGTITYDEYNNPQKSASIINITGGAASFWGKF